MRWLLHHPTAAGLAGLIGVPGVWAVVGFVHHTTRGLGLEIWN